MAKKRNCRKSDFEKSQHERAIRIRKMTDSQLCEYLDYLDNARVCPADCEGAPGSASRIIDRFLCKLDESCGTGNGIGKSTVFKLRKFAEKAEREGLLDGV